MNNAKLLGLLLALGACSGRTTWTESKPARFNLGSTSIIGGKEVDENSPIAPITAAIIADGEFVCSASILSPNLILTAAHCVTYGNIPGPDSQRYTPAQLEVAFGRNIEAAGVEHRQVATVNTHGHWFEEIIGSKLLDAGDIALVRIEGEIPAGYYPATLLGADRPIETAQEMIVAGYGIHNRVENAWDGLLRTAEQLLVAEHTFGTTEVLLNQNHGQSACYGDSGGPAYRMVDGQLYLWGVASRLERDPETQCNGHIVYTRIDSYQDWIATSF